MTLEEKIQDLIKESKVWVEDGDVSGYKLDEKLLAKNIKFLVDLEKAAAAADFVNS